MRTVPGTNIQADEGELFDAILRRQKPDCRSLIEELRVRLPEAEIVYAYGYPIAGRDRSGFAEALEAAVKLARLIAGSQSRHNPNM